MTRLLSTLAVLALAVPPITAQNSCCCKPTTTKTSGCCTDAPAKQAQDCNRCCPVDGKTLAAKAPTVRHNGFTVGVCSSACAEKFAKFSDRKKDIFIAKSTKPVKYACALTGCPNVAPLAQPITHKGTLFQVCCPSCRAWWSTADKKSREAVFARVVAARDGKPVPKLASPPSLCCAGDSPQGVQKRMLTTKYRIGAGFAVCGASISIASVEDGSPASKAGLLAGDIIVTINGKDPSVAALRTVLTAGKPIAFEVSRDDKIQKLTLTPERKGTTAVKKGQTAPAIAAVRKAADRTRRLLKTADNIKPISSKGADVKTAFNADRGKTRLLIIVSPT